MKEMSFRFFLKKQPHFYLHIKKNQLIQMPHDTPIFFSGTLVTLLGQHSSHVLWKLEHFYTMLETKVAPCC